MKLYHDPRHEERYVIAEDARSAVALFVTDAIDNQISELAACSEYVYRVPDDEYLSFAVHELRPVWGGGVVPNKTEVGELPAFADELYVLVGGPPELFVNALRPNVVWHVG